VHAISEDSHRRRHHETTQDSTSPGHTISAPATEAGARKLLQLAQRLDRNAARRTAADAKKALLDLFRWATGGKKTGNPYQYEAVRESRRALGDPAGYELPAKRPSGRIEGALYDLSAWATSGDRLKNPYSYDEVQQANRALGGDGYDLPSDLKASRQAASQDPMQSARESVIDAIQTLNDYERELEYATDPMGGRRFPDGYASFPRELKSAFGDVIDQLVAAEKAIDKLERAPKHHGLTAAGKPRAAHRRRRRARRRSAATGTPDEARFNVNMAIGELNLWGEDLEKRWGSWSSIPSDLKRDFGRAIDLLDEAEELIERLGSKGYMRAARRSAPAPRTASDDGYLVSVTYETWTPEDVEFGETDDRGWELEDEWFPALDELDSDSFIRQRQWLGWSNSTPSARSWIYSADEEDYRTGERTQYHLFVERADGQPLSRDEIAELSRELDLR